MLAALTASAVALTACGGGSSSADDKRSTGADFPTGKTIPSDPVELTMWWWGDQEAAGARRWLAETVQAYEAEHPNVTIKTVLQTTDSLVPAFNTAAAARRGPDIQFFWGGINSLEPAWRGYIRPISKYIPRDELAHYVNAEEDTFDGEVWTMPWYVQPSFPVLYRKDVLRSAGVEPPETFDELLAACDALVARGITPISGGLKDGFFAGWLYSMLGNQNVSAGDVLAAVAGEQRFDDERQAAWWRALQALRDRRCFNDDINSLQLYQGQQRWSDGKAAMTVTAGSDVRKFVESVGVDKVGLMPMPRWADGEYAGKLGSTSQTLGITSTTKYPQVAADFLRFMHTPDRMNSFFRTTGAIPADDRFDGAQIELPQLKQIFDYTKEFSPYLEDFIPTELDAKGMFSQVQLLMGGNADADEAAEAIEQLAQRLRTTRPDERENFAKWAASYR
ncbi:ABC transporter substrate-binding protein [Conexibacter woesei]|uniref:ABC transporter substrate-binding protein n=1 Tax=Conexibacter woesei TaxID=191495 RepID=UPI000311C784|nr:extracellular solute-binding protein [Conexibacter woesei]